MNRIFIDDTEYTDSSDLRYMSIEFGEYETDYKLASGIRIKGEGFTYLTEGLLGCDFYESKVRVFYAKCKKWYDFKLTRKGIEFCYNPCEANLTLERDDDAFRCMKYLKETIYWKDGLLNKAPYFIPYVTDSGLIQYIFLLFFLILSPVALLIPIVCATINRLIDAVNFLNPACITTPFGNIGPCIDSIDCPSFNDVICPVLEKLAGVGNFNPSYTLRDIFQHAAEQCGLELKSSILEGSYGDVALFQLQYRDGIAIEDISISDLIAGDLEGVLDSINLEGYYEEQGANYTYMQLIDSLRPVFNWEMRILGNKLCIERHDYFKNIKQEAADLRQYPEPYCVRPSDLEECAYFRGEYCRDAQDQAGNENRILFADIVEWNEEDAEWKEGECTQIASDYGMSAFMFDYKYCSGGFFNTRRLFDKLRSGGLSAIVGEGQLLGLGNFSGFILDIITECPSLNLQQAVVTASRASCLKLIQLETNTPRGNPSFLRKNITSVLAGVDNILEILGIEGTCFTYNYTLSYREDEEEGLYQNFWFIEDPDYKDRPRFQIDELNLDLDCDVVNKLGNGIYVRTDHGKAYPQSIEIDEERCAIILRNLLLYCE